MLGIVKKNLIYTKRNIVKSIFLFLYPSVLMGLVMFVLRFIGFNVNYPENRHEKKYLEMPVFQVPGSFQYIPDSLFGIISSDQGVLDDFQAFHHTKICPRCLYKAFNSSASFDNYLLSEEYKELPSAFSFVIDFGVTDLSKNITVSVKSRRNTFEAVYLSTNEFRLSPGSMSTYGEYSPNTKYWANLQNSIATFLLEQHSKNVVSNGKTLQINQMPLVTPKIDNAMTDDAYIAIWPCVYALTCMAYIFAFVNWMVDEKEKKLKDFIMRQGITRFTYAMSWFITYLLLISLPVIISSLIFRFLFMTKVNFLLIFLTQLLFLINMFGMCYLLAAFVNNVNSGQTLIKLFYLGITLVSFLLRNPEVNCYVKYFFCLFPQFTEIVNFEMLLMLNNFPNGCDWTLANKLYNGFTLVSTFIVFLIDFALYILLALIINTYQESGLGCLPYVKHLLTKKAEANENKEAQMEEDNSDLEADKGNAEVNHEEIISELLIRNKANDEILSIQNVTKRFDQFVAVNHFSGELYPNQIFCLLGHNGAGKSTLIKMISGIENLDEGDIRLNGRSLVMDKDYLRKNIGLCPQEDIYFEYLTVTEHLRLMFDIRNESSDNKEIDELIRKIGLAEKKDSICSTLSGGQKRKLCIALALIGKSKLILLDEPTSGVDVVSQRFLWEFLKGYKANKIIIFTTHSLDEAEYLGDRIGIMSEGRFLCSGTSSYLKNKYSCGFNVNFIINRDVFTKEVRASFINELKEIDPSTMIKITSKEVFVVNFQNLSEKVYDLFSYIDNIKAQKGIVNYTVSTTSLEDVFLKLNSNEVSMDLFNDHGFDSKLNNSFKENISNESKTSWWSEYYGNCKRYLNPIWRNKSSFLFELFASALTIVLSMVFINAFLNTDNAAYQSLKSLFTSSTPIYYKLLDNSIHIDYFSKSFLSSTLSSPINLVELEDVVLSPSMTLQEMQAEVYLKSYYKNERAVMIISKNDANGMIANILYQSVSENYSPALMNLIVSSFLDKEHNVKATIVDSYSGMPEGAKKRASLSVVSISLASVLLVWFSFISLSGAIIIVPLKERLRNIKHMLYLSGANMINYWLSMMTVDFFKYLIFMIIVFPFLIYVNSNFIYVLPLVFFFIILMNLLSYIFSFFFSKEETGQKMYLLIMPLISLGFIMIYVLRNMYSFSVVYSFSECDLLPTTTFIATLLKLFLMDYMTIGDENSKWSITQSGMIVFSVQIVVYGGILALFEMGLIDKFFHLIYVKCALKEVEDDPQLQSSQMQSQTENRNEIEIHTNLIQKDNHIVSIDNKTTYAKEEIEKMKAKKMTVSLWNISKTFCVCCGKRVKAINRLYLGLEPNEKFGLLGFNGAGKTTTFKAVTNEILFDTGFVSLLNVNIKDRSRFDTIRQTIGFCPQENALFDHMTVEETINYFKALKGVSSSDMDIYNQFGLEKYLKTFCKNLSGGNKRKLIFAIALMNHPRLLLLDEPSTGVDPESRRIMWKNINQLSQYQPEYNMILTTHSMEEAEILCDSVGWLKHGNFVCKGNPEKLKLQFNKGYYLHIKFNLPRDNAIKLSFDKEELVNLYKISPELLDKDPSLLYHFNKLDEVIGQIRRNCKDITLETVGSDNSFELLLQISPDKQGMLFSQLLTFTKTDPLISEININIETLEKIVTSFE